MNLIQTNYENRKDKLLVEEFITSTTRKKFILGINKLAKSVQKHIQVDGIIDDFTRVQSSRRKKNIYTIDEVPQNALILSTSSGSPLEVKDGLDERGFEHFNYLAFFKYTDFDLNSLKEPPFICDFEDDFNSNKKEYENTYNLLLDEKSKEVFTKVINFKISFDFDFMQGFTNNHEEQYFDEDLIPKIKDIVFVDGGSYIGDTLPSIMKYFPDFKKIFCVEPNNLHINIAKKNYQDIKGLEFINCGLGKRKEEASKVQESQANCAHDYQAENTDTIDNLIKEQIDFIKLDIEGAEQDALLGAKNTILKYRPILAVCVYHKAEDWYKIPQIVLDIDSSYDVYLRHYMEGIYETVMYFIPKNNK